MDGWMDGWLGLVGWDAGGMDVSYVCTGDTMSSVAAGDCGCGRG